MILEEEAANKEADKTKCKTSRKAGFCIFVKHG